ncbi:hypothetical protein [Nostoc sp.]
MLRFITQGDRNLYTTQTAIASLLIMRLVGKLQDDISVQECLCEVHP